MEDSQYMREVNDAIDKTIDNWSPDKNEEKEVRMMRALLRLNAFSLDCQRVLRGEKPIRTDYPLALPIKKEIKIETIYEDRDRGKFFPQELFDYLDNPVSHSAIKLSEGEYVILSGEPVYIAGSAKEKEYIAKKALGKLSKEEREALGL